MAEIDDWRAAPCVASSVTLHRDWLRSWLRST